MEEEKNMKKYLLPENGKFYKANLHMHTNVSDGQMSPEETKIEFEFLFHFVEIWDYSAYCPLLKSLKSLGNQLFPFLTQFLVNNRMRKVLIL